MIKKVIFEWNVHKILKRTLFLLYNLYVLQAVGFHSSVFQIQITAMYLFFAFAILFLFFSLFQNTFN